jgi:hypothetical protein
MCIIIYQEPAETGQLALSLCVFDVQYIIIYQEPDEAGQTALSLCVFDAGAGRDRSDGAQS